MDQFVDKFDQLLAQARASADLAHSAPNAERLTLTIYGPAANDDLQGNTAMGMLPSISARAIDLIVAFEVGGEQAYNQRYRHPIWPRGQSGVTCGIGYDIGYVTPLQLAADWHGHTFDANIALLSKACGIKGTAALLLLPPLAAIDIGFASAMAVFHTTVQHTIGQTLRALPNAAALNGDCLGALVSLVNNRGASFALAGERYLEMRQIREDVAARRFALVPQRLRSMKRLWEHLPDARGLLRRRELEAVLFEAGLTDSQAVAGAEPGRVPAPRPAAPP